jgi:hypothetical protein
MIVAPRLFFALEMTLTFGTPVLLGLYELRSLRRRRRPGGPFREDPRPPERPRPTHRPDSSPKLPACLVPVPLDPNDVRLLAPQDERELA